MLRHAATGRGVLLPPLAPPRSQITSEAAKYRYRSGGAYDVGGLTIRAPYGELWCRSSGEAGVAPAHGWRCCVACSR